MTGIERLRGVAGFWRENKLDDIVEQIEREQGGRVSRMRVLSVVTEMERHCLGHEGMEDSPVAHWARELREALGGDVRDPAADVSVSAYDLLPEEDREAAAWVRKHGGLDYVKSEWRSRVPYDRYERRRQRLLGHIAECETALGRRREIISELNHRASDLTRENAELRKRAMPEGMEWPRYESGEPVMLGDSVVKYVGGGEFEVRSMEFRDGATYLREGFRTNGIVIVRPGERVKRPAPKVLDADGAECHVGDHGYWLDQPGVEVIIKHIDPREMSQLTVYDVHGRGNTIGAEEFTHRAPVLAADGKPLREGETVYHVADGKEYTVEKLFEDGAMVTHDGITGGRCRAEYLTHERPVLDADGVPIKVGDTVYPKYPYEEQDRQVESAEVVYIHRWGRVDIQAKYATGMSFRQQVDAKQLTHTKPEPPKRCRDCAHWQKDPTADKMGVCWFFYHEHEGQDCYPARLGDIGACEEFMPRARALAGDA